MSSFGRLQDAKLLIVGLAPGLRGANRTGRPFTGDYAGDLLYATLEEFGWTRGCYDSRPDDGLQLIDAAITNAVRCVPPENKPTTQEIKTCNRFLCATLDAVPAKAVVLVLGRIAHEAVLRAGALKIRDYAFGHGEHHVLPSGLNMVSSYHCSRYNTQTGRLTPEMFADVFRTVDQLLDRSAGA